MFPPPSPPCSEEHFNFNLEELSYPKNPKMCDPILVTLLKMQPHYTQSSRENATPSTGISAPPGRPKTIISFE